jgi:hypothetical protein
VHWFPVNWKDIQRHGQASVMDSNLMNDFVPPAAQQPGPGPSLSGSLCSLIFYWLSSSSSTLLPYSHGSMQQQNHLPVLLPRFQMHWARTRSSPVRTYCRASRSIPNLIYEYFWQPPHLDARVPTMPTCKHTHFIRREFIIRRR